MLFSLFYWHSFILLTSFVSTHPTNRPDTWSIPRRKRITLLLSLRAKDTQPHSTHSPEHNTLSPPLFFLVIGTHQLCLWTSYAVNHFLCLSVIFLSLRSLNSFAVLCFSFRTGLFCDFLLCCFLSLSFISPRTALSPVFLTFLFPPTAQLTSFHLLFYSTLLSDDNFV